MWLTSAPGGARTAQAIGGRIAGISRQLPDVRPIVAQVMAGLCGGSARIAAGGTALECMQGQAQPPTLQQPSETGPPVSAWVASAITASAGRDWSACA